jgi:uncharacterized protein
MQMIGRRLHAAVLEHLQQFPAVALLGPRQAGKTTLAEMIRQEKSDSVYLDLESPGDRNKLIDPESYLGRFDDRLVILDEVQRVPELFQPLRGLIDRARRRGPANGLFLLLGSAPENCCVSPVKASRGVSLTWNYPPFRSLKSMQLCTTSSGCGAGFPTASWRAGIGKARSGGVT